MMFLGDIAIPDCSCTFLDGVIRCDAGAVVVANLEGAIPPELTEPVRYPRMFNSPACLPFLRSLGVSVVSGANNHILDWGAEAMLHTTSLLHVNNIQIVGCGADLREAMSPQFVVDCGRRVALMGFGWETIGCQPAGWQRAGVNPLRPHHVLRSIRSLRTGNPDIAIVVLMHWNYELELYPQPMHRQLAFSCIESGANAVIGCHPHCVGGAEWHDDAPILYSLGNWFLPQGVFFAGRLRFPKRTNLQLAFEWQPGSADAVCHWFSYSPKTHAILPIAREAARQSERFAALTPFAGMTHPEYVRWFGRHRLKRRFVPVYSDYRHTLRNSMLDSYVKARQVIVGGLFKTRLRRTLTDAQE